MDVPHCEYEQCPACGRFRSNDCDCDTEELRESDEPITAPRQKPMARKLVIVLGCVLIVLLLLTGWTILIVLRKQRRPAGVIDVAMIKRRTAWHEDCLQASCYGG